MGHTTTTYSYESKKSSDLNFIQHIKSLGYKTLSVLDEPCLRIKTSNVLTCLSKVLRTLRASLQRAFTQSRLTDLVLSCRWSVYNEIINKSSTKKNFIVWIWSKVGCFQKKSNERADSETNVQCQTVAMSLTTIQLNAFSTTKDPWIQNMRAKMQT